MGYEPDLGRISLKQYQNHLKRIELLPSRTVLCEQIDERFARLESAGISDLDALRKAIGSEKSRTRLMEKTGIPEEYLNILRRESGSLIPKRVKLTGFPGVGKDLTDQLAAIGIRNSKDVFERLTQTDAMAAGAGPEAYADLAALCDIARICGVGGVAARIFVDAGYRTVREVAEAHARTLWEDTCAVNERKAYYGGKLAVKDMQFCIDCARLLMETE